MLSLILVYYKKPSQQHETPLGGIPHTQYSVLSMISC